MDKLRKFIHLIEDGYRAGSSTQTIVKAVHQHAHAAGLLDVDLKTIGVFVYDELSRLADTQRHEFALSQADMYAGFRHVATLDGHTCIACIAYDGAEWDLACRPINGNTLAYRGVRLHSGCRCTEVPFTRSLADLFGFPADNPYDNRKPSRPSSFGPVNGDGSFDYFLRLRTPEWQDGLLGPERAQMWREGNLKLRQMVNDDGSVRTMDELRQLVDK